MTDNHHYMLAMQEAEERREDYLRDRLKSLLLQIEVEGPVDYLMQDYEHTLSELPD